MPPFSFTPFLQGFGLSVALIMAIGAQNAFVLQQGLRRQHVFATAAICALCDAALIVLGVAGLGAVITQSAQLTALATWGGAAFLFAYGARAFWSALRPGMLDAEQSTLRGGALATTVLAALGVSLLNPHVYLDTVVLVGSVGGRYPAGDRVAFAAGAMSASCVWFFGLAYGAAWLAPIFRRPRAWRLLDLAVGAIMWAIAASLIWG